MKKITILVFSTLIYILSINSVFASGYLGAAIGSTSPDEQGFEDDTGFKFTGGFNINENLAIEASYTSLGEFEADQQILNQLSFLTGFNVTSSSIEITGIELSGLGIAPISDTLSVFGRVGMFLWDADINVTVSGFGSGTDTDDGSDIFFGFGVILDISDQMSLKAEYNLYDALDGDVDFIGVALNINL